MKVYVPMKLNPAFMMRKDSFTDFEGLHYKTEEEAKKALNHIRENPTTLESKGYGVFCANKVTLPTVTAICEINIPDYEWPAHIKNDEMQAERKFGDCYRAKFEPSRVDVIRVQISGDALHAPSPTYLVRASNAFNTADIATELEQRAESLQRFAEALDRTPMGIRMKVDVPACDFSRVETQDSQNLAQLYSHKGLAFGDRNNNIGLDAQAMFLRDLSHVTSVDAGLHAQQLQECFNEAVRDILHGALMTNEWQYVQALSMAIKNFAEELQPIDYAKAMGLQQHAAEYVRVSLEAMKEQGGETYGFAFQDRAPTHLRGELMKEYGMTLTQFEHLNPGAPDNCALAMQSALRRVMSGSNGLSTADANAMTALLNEASEDIRNIREDIEVDDIEFDDPIE